MGLGPLAFRKELHQLRGSTLLEVSASLEGPRVTAADQKDEVSSDQKDKVSSDQKDKISSDEKDEVSSDQELEQNGLCHIKIGAEQKVLVMLR